MKVPYSPTLKANSRLLRNNQTKEEKLLWFHLRKKNLKGYLFSRQKPIDNYIVDFVCFKLKLIIEVDGSDHEYRFEEDLVRQKTLENLDFYVFRVRNEQVRKNLEGVVEAIKIVIDDLEKD
ncbi:MAG: hypothetical protein US42_C0002G0075 [Candidatus Magasanikbacteria bacterium GW2011_GWC2_37_14]|uniref:DUF559 domain-containing protein n=1 Tax=Candidatus Magasanikbacteria bacterium GW2011_GWC2_37_14 TaxID=1619046 RepID=A0A0G0GPQ2_9BACT|nr:MAG: hypothetical protein US42_C0002G0075 [Candidatus Magasanikbacteria bacterium GW2011_GWC2_37_14]